MGKIDIKGPDAAKLLDFVYTNTFSTLLIGRVKYGLMLREDGYVMDDETTARLSETHYLMTTTTAAVSQVMAHLEFVHQCLHPEWDVSFNSVTEHWTHLRLPGRRHGSFERCFGPSPKDADWPFMSCGAVHFGVKGRLFHLFSGELGLNWLCRLAGDSLFRIDNQSRRARGCVYGLEALNVLRVEKGFITHAEIDGRVTAMDLGQRMVSQKKDARKTASERPGLMDCERPRLIGLERLELSNNDSRGASFQ